MLYELRTYTLCPGGMGPWLELYETQALPVLASIESMHLVGYFRAETGLLNRVVHLWAYPDSRARDEALRSLAAHPEWLSRFVLPARPYLVAQESTLLSPASFSPLQ